jgi:serpin B
MQWVRRSVIALSSCAALAMGMLMVAPKSARADAPPADVKAISASANQFAFDLYHKLNDGAGNIIFSPYSIDTAVGMLDVGARGDTHSEIAKAMHQPAMSTAAFQAAMGRLISSLQAAKSDQSETPKKGYELHVADALWGQAGVAWLPDYLAAMKTNFGAGLESLDFRDEPTSRKTINDWVSQQTADKIKDLIPPGAITADTRMVLTNAVYFKADWQRQFEADQTRPGDFHAGAKADAIQAPLMHMNAPFDYMETPRFQAVRMPYVGNDISMIVLLPRAIDGLAAMEKTLDSGLLDNVTAGLKSQQLNVTLPKFKATQTIPLDGTLAALGIKKAFTTQADFSGMTGSPNIYLSSAIHKAFIAVDEAGTEAAAATAVMMRAMSIRIDPPATDFIADHPFVYLLVDKTSGAILFIGRVTDPTTEA